jgi:single-strand DNA-binding protein
MSSKNQVNLIGRLGKEPELKEFSNGGKLCNVTIATSERWTDKNSGEQREETEWHSLVFNGKLADLAAQYLKKGDAVSITGKIKTRSWAGDDGQTRYRTEIACYELQFLSNGRTNETAQSSKNDASDNSPF